MCAIDEFNLYKGDFGDVNTAMESGQVIISKVVKARLPVKASIIAGANPESKHAKRKKFNKMIPVHEQLTMDFALLSRFDQIFVIKDEANKDKDEMIAMAMLKGLTDTEEGVVEIENIKIDMDLIHKFLEVAKKRTPKLSKSASEYIQKQHALKRSEAASDDELSSHRQVAALARLTIAAAKFDGVKTATLKHVKFVEDIMATTLQEEDPAAVDGGMSKGKDIRDKIAETFVSLVKNDFMIDDRTLGRDIRRDEENMADYSTNGRCRECHEAIQRGQGHNEYTPLTQWCVYLQRDKEPSMAGVVKMKKTTEIIKIIEKVESVIAKVSIKSDDLEIEIEKTPVTGRDQHLPEPTSNGIEVPAFEVASTRKKSAPGIALTIPSQVCKGPHAEDIRC